MRFKMKICCLGDSLTEGDYGIYGKSGIGNVHAENYPYYLHLLSGAEVLNFGKCGYTSSSYLNFYDDGNVDLNGCDIIIIMLGTNGGLDPESDTKENADFVTLIDRCRRDCPGCPRLFYALRRMLPKIPNIPTADMPKELKRP